MISSTLWGYPPPLGELVKCEYNRVTPSGSVAGLPDVANISKEDLKCQTKNSLKR